MQKAASMKHSVKDWVDSALCEDGPAVAHRGPTLARNSDDLLGGCDVKELDLSSDTMPAELIEFFQ